MGRNVFLKAGAALLLILLQISPMVCPAQSKDTACFGTVERNDPEKLPKLCIRLYPVVLPIYFQSIMASLSFGGSASWQVSKTVAISGSASYGYYPYANLFADLWGSTAVPIIERHWYNFEGGATWYFIHKSGRKSEEINGLALGSAIPLLKVGCHASVNVMNAPLGNDAKELQMYNSVYDKGPITSMYGDVFTNDRSTYFALGLIGETALDLIIKETDGIEKNHSRKRELYADLILSSHTEYDDVVFLHDQKAGLDFNVNKYTEKEYLGGRMGYTYTALRPAGLTNTIEFGYMPNTKIYVMYKIGMALNR